MSSMLGEADCWNVICQGLGCPSPANAMPPTASAATKARAGAADRINRMSTSIGVSAPSSSTFRHHPSRNLQALGSRVAYGCRQAPALGDSATNGALRLLKPQFSPTRNAPLVVILPLRPAFRRRCERLDSTAVFRLPGSPAPFLTRLKQHVRRLGPRCRGGTRFGSKRLPAVRLPISPTNALDTRWVL